MPIRGNKTGWTSINHHGHEMSVPKGLTVSVEKGRVDNGPGNGGEHPGHHTPSHHGEDGPYDEDPNQDFLGFGTRCIPEVLRTVTDG